MSTNLYLEKIDALYSTLGNSGKIIMMGLEDRAEEDPILFPVNVTLYLGFAVRQGAEIGMLLRQDARSFGVKELFLTACLINEETGEFCIYPSWALPPHQLAQGSWRTSRDAGVYRYLFVGSVIHFTEQVLHNEEKALFDFLENEENIWAEMIRFELSDSVN